MRKEIALNGVNAILERLDSQLSVFERRDVAKLLFKTFKNTDKAQDYLMIVEQVLNHKKVRNSVAKINRSARKKT